MQEIMNIGMLRIWLSFMTTALHTGETIEDIGEDKYSAAWIRAAIDIQAPQYFTDKQKERLQQLGYISSSATARAWIALMDIADNTGQYELMDSAIRAMIDYERKDNG